MDRGRGLRLEVRVNSSSSPGAKPDGRHFWPNAARWLIQCERASMKDLSYRQSMLKIVQPLELWWMLNTQLKSIAVNRAEFLKVMFRQNSNFDKKYHSAYKHRYKKSPAFTRFACSNYWCFNAHFWKSVCCDVTKA